MPMSGVMRDILEAEVASMRGEEDFFSVASTMPFAALMPREVTPWFTALRAYSGSYSSVRFERGGVALFGGRDTYLHQLAAVGDVSEGFLFEVQAGCLTWARRW